MKKQRKGNGNKKNISLLLSIILVFSILGAVVFSVANKISAEMSASAIQNLSESLDLMKGTIEAILRKEAEFQKLMALEIAQVEDMEEFICVYNRNQTMAKISLILSGEAEGISDSGEVFTEEGLDFSAGRQVEGLPVSISYVNYMGAWAYTMKCPVVKDGRDAGGLYIEYIYETLDESLPDGFYNGRAMLYIMDSVSERLVLNPKGMGERNAGHLNLEDFYRANRIEEEELQAEVKRCVEHGDNVMFYHKIQQKDALAYMWAVNEGTVYLIGYVPVEAVQQEGRTVNQNIFIVVAVMLVAFFLCCVLYYFNQRQQNRIRREREAEREVHNKRLAEALQAAQAASNSKTMFLSNMSHDIRTPMNAVLGFTALLDKDAENPSKVREYTKKITASGQHLLGLINDILDISKIESGKVVLTVEEFTLSNLVSSIDAIIRPMAKAKKQTFHVEAAGVKHEYFIGDETRMNQVLINLLSNSVKYTPEGGDIWLRIMGLKQRSSQYGHIRIEVEDNGYGMTPEYLTTVFDAFTRAENSTTNKVQGTGLGMAITKNIVELMGGSIDVSSEVGKGSKFRVELELRIPQAQVDNQFWEANGISRILLGNQDMQDAQNLKQLMEGVGVQVDIAQDTQAILRMAKDNGERYGAVLLEYGVAGTQSAHLAEKIRAALPEAVPVLLLADYDAEGVEETLVIANTGALSKPFFVSAFQEKLLEMQEGRQEEAEAGTETAGGVNLEGMHFLAAEDNEINAEILSEILKIEGASCEVAENGLLALERFQDAPQGTFDAILMDVQMPVMNGYDATRAIRALDREDACTIPIIAMTANAFAEDEKEALDAGMDVHLAKPIDVELLKEVLIKYVERDRL